MASRMATAHWGAPPMNDFLLQAFGDNGALVAKSAGATVVVLLLALALYWLAQRFPRDGVNGTGRTRIPRLAIVDAMAVDARRRLLLVRRDGVEHLILVGGPSDLVIEPSIARPRRAVQPATAAGPTSVAIGGEMPDLAADDPPVMARADRARKGGFAFPRAEPTPVQSGAL